MIISAYPEGMVPYDRTLLSKELLDADAAVLAEAIHLGGAVLDNIGSTGMQMAIFPVCFNQVATLGMYYARPSLRVRCGAHLTSFPPRPASPRSMSSDRPSSHKSTRMSTNRCRTTHTSGWLRATCSRSFPAS